MIALPSIITLKTTLPGELSKSVDDLTVDDLIKATLSPNELEGEEVNIYKPMPNESIGLLRANTLLVTLREKLGGEELTQAPKEALLAGLGRAGFDIRVESEAGKRTRVQLGITAESITGSDTTDSGRVVTKKPDPEAVNRFLHSWNETFDPVAQLQRESAKLS